MKKNQPTPWYEKLVGFINSEKMNIPIITGIPKGDRSVKLGASVSKSAYRQMQVIQAANPKKYQTVPDVQRALVNFAAPIFYKMEVENDDDHLMDVASEEQKFAKKMMRLDDFTTTMHKMYQCFQSGVFAGDDDGDEMQRQEANLAKWNEMKRKWLDIMKKEGLLSHAERKLKMIQGGDKVTNLLECKTRGGNRK